MRAEWEVLLVALRDMRQCAIDAWPPNIIDRHKQKIERENAELDAYWAEIRRGVADEYVPVRSRDGGWLRLF